MDTFRLGAIINELIYNGDDFCSEVARELFDSLPDETDSRIKLRINHTTTKPTFQGETNLGSASLNETEEKEYKYGYSRGTYAGKWRVTKFKNTVIIEPKFHNDLETEKYRLIFNKNGSIKLQKMRYYTIGYKIYISFGIFADYKKMRKV